MRPIALNDYLTNDNPWTQRIIGCESFNIDRKCMLV